MRQTPSRPRHAGGNPCGTTVRRSRKATPRSQRKYEPPVLENRAYGHLPRIYTNTGAPEFHPSLSLASGSCHEAEHRLIRPTPREGPGVQMTISKLTDGRPASNGDLPTQGEGFERNRDFATVVALDAISHCAKHV